MAVYEFHVYGWTSYVIHPQLRGVAECPTYSWAVRTFFRDALLLSIFTPLLFPCSFYSACFFFFFSILFDTFSSNELVSWSTLVHEISFSIDVYFTRDM